MRTSPYHLLTGRLILCKSSLTVKKIWRRAGSKFSIGSPPSFSTGSTGTAAVLNGLRTAFPLNSGDKLTPIPLTLLCKYHSRRSRCSNESWAMFGTSAGLKSESRLNCNRPHWLSPLAQWSCILGGLMFNRIRGRSHHCVNTFFVWCVFHQWWTHSKTGAQKTWHDVSWQICNNNIIVGLKWRMKSSILKVLELRRSPSGLILKELSKWSWFILFTKGGPHVYFSSVNIHWKLSLDIIGIYGRPNNSGAVAADY